MTKRVVAHEYDHQWNEIARETFEWVEQAQEWCEARRNHPQPLEWGDTQIGLEGNTLKNIDSLDATGHYSPAEPIFQISAIANENPDEIEELDSFHYDPKKATDEELKFAWDEATRQAEDIDDWNIVAEYENEINKRDLNQKGGVE